MDYANRVVCALHHIRAMLLPRNHPLLPRVECYYIEMLVHAFVESNQPRENRLLAALPPEDYERLLPQLTNVLFDLGEVVYEFGGKLD